MKSLLRRFVPFFLTMITATIALCQTTTDWTYVGAANFAGPSVGNANYDLATCGGVIYALVADPSNGNKATSFQFNGTSWEVIGKPGFTMYPYSYNTDPISSCKCYKDTLYMTHSSAYGYYATVYKLNGTTWERMTSGGFGTNQATYASLDFDTQGAPYVAFGDYSPVAADKATGGYVSKLVGTTWQRVGNQRIDVGGLSHISLALVGDVPYVAYVKSNDTLKVKKYNGQDWVLVAEPIISTDLERSLLEVDNNTLYVTYLLTNGKAVYDGYMAKLVGDKWENIGQGAAFSGNFMDVKVVGGIPYIAYRNASNKLDVVKYEMDEWKPVGTQNITNVSFTNYPKLEFLGETPIVSFLRGVDNKVSVLSYGTLTGLDEQTSDGKAAAPFVYPNPAEGIVHMRSETVATIRFYTMAGVLQQTISIHGNHSISTSSFPAGMYICELEEGTTKRRTVLTIK